jgi:hypothetical protein
MSPWFLRGSLIEVRGIEYPTQRSLSVPFRMFVCHDNIDDRSLLRRISYTPAATMTTKVTDESEPLGALHRFLLPIHRISLQKQRRGSTLVSAIRHKRVNKPLRVENENVANNQIICSGIRRGDVILLASEVLQLHDPQQSLHDILLSGH